MFNVWAYIDRERSDYMSDGAFSIVIVFSASYPFTPLTLAQPHPHTNTQNAALLAWSMNMKLMLNSTIEEALWYKEKRGVERKRREMRNMWFFTTNGTWLQDLWFPLTSYDSLKGNSTRIGIYFNPLCLSPRATDNKRAKCPYLSHTDTHKPTQYAYPPKHALWPLRKKLNWWETRKH